MSESQGKRGRGRPVIGRRVPVVLPEDLIADLDAYASQHGISRAEAVRALLVAALTDLPRRRGRS